MRSLLIAIAAMSAIVLGLLSLSQEWLTNYTEEFARRHDQEVVRKLLERHPNPKLRKAFLGGLATGTVVVHVTPDFGLKREAQSLFQIEPDPTLPEAGIAHIWIGLDLVYNTDSRPFYISTERSGTLLQLWQEGRMGDYERMSLGVTTPEVIDRGCVQLLMATWVGNCQACELEAQAKFTLEAGPMSDENSQTHAAHCAQMRTREGVEVTRQVFAQQNLVPNCTDSFSRIVLRDN